MGGKKYYFAFYRRRKHTFFEAMIKYLINHPNEKHLYDLWKD